MKKPIIGIPLDYHHSGGYSKFPWYALRENYLESIIKVGGIPVAIVNNALLIDDYLHMIDGLLITGGGFDVDPVLYGEMDRHETVNTNPKRTQFEWEIIVRAIELKMPILAICGGEQLLNVVLGGTLIQDIPDNFPSDTSHFSPQIPANMACHKIIIQTDTKLFEVVKTKEMRVNSRHHQAVNTLGQDVIVSARAEDGLIEGIEYGPHPFCLGVQWHPEFFVDDQDEAIITAFIEASRQYKK
jgi:putative glutamine amidotransferase